MGVKVDLKGLDQLQRKLKDLEHKARVLDGKHQIQLSELFPASFLRAHTRFSSLDDLESKARERGFSLGSQEDWDNLPGDQWDAFIAEHTHFTTWKDMLGKGAAEWTSRQLGFK
jgi:hypothetical protein